MGRVHTFRWRGQHDLAELWASVSPVVCINLPGYHPGTGFGSVLIGTLYALVDGAIGGAIFCGLYNRFAENLL